MIRIPSVGRCYGQTSGRMSIPVGSARIGQTHRCGYVATERLVRLDSLLHFHLGVLLDDERFVMLGVARFDVLHAQKFTQVIQELFPVNCEPEAVGVDVGGLPVVEYIHRRV
jgi:hypothetical protein